MSLLQSIRNWAGVKSVDVTDEQPIDLFEKANLDWIAAQDVLLKAQDEFNEVSTTLELKIEACNKLIEKGSVEGEYNKTVLEKRLDTISNEFLEKARGLVKSINESKETRDGLEEDILTKSIELTALLSDEERGRIEDICKTWMDTGLVKGEQINNQLRAMVMAIDSVVKEDLEKAGEGSRGGHVIGHTRSGKAIYADRNASHESYKDFSEQDHKDATNLHFKKMQRSYSGSRGTDFGQRTDKSNHHEAIAQSHMRANDIESGHEKIKKLGDAVYSASHGELEGAVGKFHEHTAKMGVPYHESHKMLKEHGRTIQKSEEEIGALFEEIEKGGEGSRGGKIIGHTKSGKPVYAGKMGWDYKDFNDQDHLDASDIHVAEKNRHEKNKTKSEKHFQAHHSHESQIDDSKIEKAESFDDHYANVICRNGDKILFLKRASDKKIAPGQWCLPGGHIDAGESITQAGARELKEEANIDCDAACLWVAAKAKCDDGKWAFYLNGCHVNTDSIALLDGESVNASWMTKEQWMDADLFFDLKDHLIVMELPEFNVDGIPTITKAEEADFFFERLEKAGGHRGLPIGTIRTWGGVKWQKISEKKWKPLKKNHRLAVADVTAHAENTSSGQLGKVAGQHPDPHLRDAAKRELERRRADKEKKEQPKQVGAVKKDVGVASKKKSKPVKYTPNEYLTDPGHKKIEKDFGKQLNKGFDFARGQYHAVNGNILNTDNARELSEEYKKDRGISMVVHEPASAFIRKLYSIMLKEPVPKNKHNKVLFSAGGTGAGKSTGMGEHVATKRLADKAHIIYDTNMNTFDSAVTKIDQALAAGKKVSILHTYREPVDAFVNGAVPRAIRMEQELGSGRTVPIGTHVNTHLGANETIPKLKEHYSGNKNVQVRVIDNSRGKGNSAQVPIGFLKDKKYVAEDLKKQLNDHIDKMYGEGKISEKLYRGFKTEGD